MTPRRLLILSPTIGRGGAEDYVLTIAEGALAAGWQVTVSLEDGSGTHGLVGDLVSRPRLRYENARVGASDVRLMLLRQALAALRVLARARPSVAMIVLPWPTSGLGLITAAALSRTPASVIFQLAPWEMPIGRRRVLYRWARRRRQQWVAVSRQNRAAIAATFALPEGSIRPIYNGVALTAAPRDADVAAARTAVRDELDLPAGARIVLTVGRLHEQKGHADILTVLPSVLEGRADTFFIWVGDGELRPALEAEVRGRGLQRHVRMLGRREDVETLLLGSDLFLLPSRFEGHPFALLEAMALGIPCVSSDAGGAPEIMRDRVDGLIHGRGRTDEMARQLTWALDHPAEMEAMAASARARVADFSESRMIDETLSMLQDLATR